MFLKIKVFFFSSKDCYNIFPLYLFKEGTSDSAFRFSKKKKKKEVILPSTSFSFGFRDEPIDICMIKWENGKLIGG